MDLYEDEERRRLAVAAEALRMKTETIKRFQVRRRQILFWSIFWSSALVLLAAVALVTWILTQGSQ